MTQAARVLGMCLGSLHMLMAEPPSDAAMKSMYKRFLHEYQPTSEFDTQRFAAFRANVLKAISMNEEQGVQCDDLFDDTNCVFGITKFSDLSSEEFAKTHLGYRRSSRDELAAPVPVLDLSELQAELAPASVDWRAKGAVTAVKDQGDCGSCWAFSATEEVESAVFMATGKLEQLSTQQIISCDKKDLGCDGGDTVSAYKYLEKAGGIDLASDYPDKSHTTGESGKCSRLHKKKVAKVTNFSYAVKPCTTGACKHQDEQGLMAALATHGPVSICVNAGDDSWQNYKRGVMTKKCSGAADDLDHCVQLVGYNQGGPTPYWIVRNSWNKDWGINGYMYLKMGSNSCGVADEATIVRAQAEEEADAAPVDDRLIV
eukprot:TRINITY_DN27134_c0_g1_i1.p1 TRINITY_DN27134_c0_g1~~TRINITY_DN27134_c0_g1_i1.p1  ORF type:complete len:372 (-),score=92.72 TRINITY_DN27134_c0_g1_i1:79-1194(-)